MNIHITPQAAAVIRRRGGQVILFEGRLTGCVAGNIPAPMMEVGRPRRPPDHYIVVEEEGVAVYLDKVLRSYPGTAEISVVPHRWNKESLSFNYREN
ncbi:Hypothetical protein DEACI_2178 [Acididesulfobacillus acetoxydans]|uniref:Uncharacterized protein n=1 Tax=Acididesulfobacillus acetoxydans TaxID=1561005 RepID=A0A8S0WYI7_9FIRM|nr:CC/Se motif family (seleno)protein [Acididesulfobacillus acetoxydans]CAA7601511.1 Hypothetical protein DEACI_2178 [Acididesulfobacillus acetoxydans]CEJ06998.1 Hypothetical protein DEACI_1452 [Acididesulfobacillus acetoxydans]